jgi:SAM-dependent methyltransferase
MHRVWKNWRSRLKTSLAPGLAYLSRKNIYARQWDAYVNAFAEINSATSRRVDWPGDEWGTPEGWKELYEELFVPAGVKVWQRAVEIGPGSGKYTVKVLADSPAVVRAYDVSAEFLKVCETRCNKAIREDRLSLHLLNSEQPDQMLTDIVNCGWKRTIDAFYSIDSMVHVDLQYLIAYLITAGQVLRPGGKLILTLADATSEAGFRKLVEDINPFYYTQGRPSGKFEWLSPDMIRSILSRLGFELEYMDGSKRDVHVIASLANLERADSFDKYLLP